AVRRLRAGGDARDDGPDLHGVLRARIGLDRRAAGGAGVAQVSHRRGREQREAVPGRRSVDALARRDAQGELRPLHARTHQAERREGQTLGYSLSGAGLAVVVSAGADGESSWRSLAARSARTRLEEREASRRGAIE